MNENGACSFSKAAMKKGRRGRCCLVASIFLQALCRWHGHLSSSFATRGLWRRLEQNTVNKRSSRDGGVVEGFFENEALRNSSNRIRYKHI